jgi:probable F420-dependent oxidoreductase
MEYGFFLPHVPPHVLETMAVSAEKAGFDLLYTDDHLMSPFADMTPDFQGCYESWTSMAYLAGKTGRIRLSHMVLVPGFRGPALLAKMAATLDLLTSGRLDLTVGAGWYEKEFHAYDIPWEKHKERLMREREAVQLIRALWTEGEVTFEGRYYQLRQATVFPKPYQQPHPPIWIGGDSRRSRELAAELGDGWLMHGHAPLEIEKLIAGIMPLLAGRKGEFGFGTAVFCLMGENKDVAESKLRRIIPDHTWNDFMKARIRDEIRWRIVGTPDDCRARINEYAAAGVTRLILIFLDPADVEWFSRDVLPAR